MAETPTPEAFPAGDPRNALYGETVASLEHAYNTTLAGDRETLSKAQTNAAYQQSLLTKAEPGTYEANEHRANAGGILESGINAQRRGTIASGYAQKRYAVTSSLHNTEDAVRRGDERASETRDAGRAKAATRALEEGRRSAEANPPVEPGTTPGTTYPYSAPAYNRGGSRLVTGPNGTGNVQPYTERTPGGSVRVGPGTPVPQVQWSRDPRVRARQAREVAAGRLRA